MKEWREFPLKHLASLPITNGLGEKGEFDDPNWPRYIRTTDIAGPKSLRPDSFKSLPPEIAKNALVATGDILMTAAGATIGKSVTYLEERPACYAGYLVRFRPNLALVDGRFIAYWMQSALYWAQVDAQRVKSTIENFSASRYRNLKLNLPPLRQQTEIADYLDAETARIDALIEKKQQMLSLLAEQFWSRIEAYFRDCRAPKVPLRRCLIDICDGPFGSSLTSSHYSDHGARVVRLGNIGFADFKEDDRAFIPTTHYVTLLRHRVSQGDLLIAGLGDSRNHVGRACVAPDLGPAIVKADCYRARIDSKLARSEYLAIFLSSPLGAQEVGLASRGSTRSRINLDIAKDIHIPLVPLEGQEVLISLFKRQRAQQRRMTDVLESQLSLLVERRQALVTAAVTGELRIPGVAA